MRRAWWLVIGLATTLAACSADVDGDCVVKGVVVDVQDGEPLVGVRVEGPGGTRAVSDPRGRFVLTGLDEGLEGSVRAWRSDGWEVKLPLRPLKRGALEVTLRLSPQRGEVHSSESG
jgi:hypothetical protein